MAPHPASSAAPPSQCDGADGPRSLDRQPLERQLAEAHKALEARLVAKMELQQAALLRALARLSASQPWRFGEDGESSATHDAAGCCAEVSQHASSQAVGQAVSFASLRSDDGTQHGVAGARSSPRAEEAGVRSLTSVGPLEVAGGEVPEDLEFSEEDEVEHVRTPAVSGKLVVADENLNRTKTVVVSGNNGARNGGASEHLGSRRQRVSKWAGRALERREFEMLISLTIAVNALSLGLSADFSIKNPGEGIPAYFRIMDHCFMCIFAAELLLRLAAEGPRFFSPGSRVFGWNMFDSFLIGATILNESAFGMNLSMVRVFRILRLVNVIRMIRLMKPFKELRMMVSGIMNCGKTLVWSILLLTVIAYIYAVFCLQISSEWLASKDADRAARADTREHGDSTVIFLDSYFPSLHYSIYTLFKAVSGGINWGDLADPLEKVSVMFLFSFPLYIVVTVFCVLNIITASFVEAAHRTVQEEDTNALEHIEARQEWINKVRHLFQKHDVDRGGTLDWEEFQTIMSDWRTQEYFTEIGLTFDFQHTRNIFRLFDWNGDGTIDVDEFALGVHHLRGSARSLDMFREFQSLNRKLDKSLRRWEKAAFQTRRRASTCRGRSSVRSVNTVSPQSEAISAHGTMVDGECWNDEPRFRQPAHSQQANC